MNISGIISISGKAGLSKIISQSRTGLIVESLMDGKRFPISGAERVSSLEDISIYTLEADILLSEVFQKIYKHFDGKESISHKSSANELKETLKLVLPDYDEERVYNSDIKKIFQWYNILLKKELLSPTTEEQTEEKKATKDSEKEN